MNEIETHSGENYKAKSCFFFLNKRTNKIDKPPAKLIKGKKRGK